MTCVEETEPKTVKGLADHFRVSRQTIYTWRAKGCPDWGIDAIGNWVEEHKGEQEEGSDLREEKLKAEIRKIRAEAYAKEMKNRVAEGELLDREELLAEFCELLAECDRILEAMVMDLIKEAREDDRPHVSMIARNAVDMAKRKLASWEPSKTDDNGSLEDI